MIGDTIIVDGIEFEVVWSGGELLAPRSSKPSPIWSPNTGDDSPYTKRDAEFWKNRGRSAESHFEDIDWDGEEHESS